MIVTTVVIACLLLARRACEVATYRARRRRTVPRRWQSGLKAAEGTDNLQCLSPPLSSPPPPARLLLLSKACRSQCFIANIGIAAEKQALVSLLLLHFLLFQCFPRPKHVFIRFHPYQAVASSPITAACYCILSSAAGISVLTNSNMWIWEFHLLQCGHKLLTSCGANNTFYSHTFRQKLQSEIAFSFLRHI